MPLRTILSLTALTVVGCVSAQVLGPIGDPDVENALTNLRQQDSLFLRLQGTVTVGNAAKAITCDQYWSRTTDTKGNPFVQSELLEYQDSRLNARVVADGATVWTYNLLTHEYQSGLYGRYDTGPAPANYLKDALAIMRAGADGYGSFNTRLISQTYNGTQATYQTWIPGATVTEVIDPANSALFDVVYTLGNPVRRQAVFHLTTVNNLTELLSIDYRDVSTLGGQPRVVFKPLVNA